MRELGQAGLAQAERKVALIGLDSFYRALSPAESRAAYAGEYNFDRPSTADPHLLL
jgi:uridine kinase